MTDETIKLVLELGGDAAVKTLTTDLERLKGELGSVATQFKQGEISSQDFVKQFGVLEGQIAQTQDVLQRLKGSPGSSGQGLLGVSYAVQDFTSQLGTRGLVGALGAVQNNIPQILMSLGAGAGMTGIISVLAVGVGALLPVIQKAFGGDTQGAIDAAKKKLEEMEATIKRVNDAFDKMANKPTAAEEESAANIRATLETRPNATLAKKAVFEHLTPGEVWAGMTPPERGERQKNIAAEMTDDQIDKLIEEDAAKDARAGIRPPGPEQRAAIKSKYVQQRNAARAKDIEVRDRLANQMLDDIKVAGPAGERARRRFGQIAAIPGALPAALAKDIADASPEAQAQRDRADDAFQEELDARHDAVQRRNANAKKAATRNKKLADARDKAQQRIGHDVAEHARGMEAQSKHTVDVQQERKHAQDQAIHKQEGDIKQMLSVMKENQNLRKQLGLVNAGVFSDVHKENAWMKQQIRQMEAMRQQNRTAQNSGLW